MCLTTIWSGGQRGADQGGLAAAQDMGLKTGGWIPHGFLTLNGEIPDLANLGLKEHKSSKYSPRTFTNVKETDGTIRLAYDFNSRGEVCTLNAIQQYDKPYYDVDLNDPDFIFDVTDWIVQNNIKVLNVAGNAGKTREQGTQIFKVVRAYLKCVFRFFTQKTTW